MSDRSVSQIVVGILGLTLLGAGASSTVWGFPAFLLGCAAGTLSLVIVLMWSSLQHMDASDSMEFEQALSYAAPSAEEEQKRAVLRTIKDLEYEMSVGKISQADFDSMSREARAEAKRLIAAADEAMKARMDAAEKRLNKHAKKAANPVTDKAENEKLKEEPEASQKSEENSASEAQA